MTFVPRRRRTIRRPKDILTLALKNLWPGDELLCTARTGDAIRSRVDAFRASKQDWRVEIISYGPIRKIRRVL